VNYAKGHRVRRPLPDAYGANLVLDDRFEIRCRHATRAGLSLGPAALNQRLVDIVAVSCAFLDEINAREAAYMEKAGFEILAITGLNLERDSDMVRVTPDYIVEFALSLDRPEAEAIFVSCGALRTLDVVGEIEARAGKPVISSNQAMIWDTLRLAGITDPIAGYGRLLAAH
jgi:maleate cis-trans isomerase